MRRIFLCSWLFGLLPTTAAVGQVPPPPGQPVQVQYEVLARGPVHEAFAVVVDGKMEPTPVVPQPPPPPLEEAPPAWRPAGDNVLWVGGYWYWAEDRNHYVWVSGCWRDAPPGRDWLPGQWVRLADGYHWVSGAWVPDGTRQLLLLPQPPEPIEEVPGPQPTPTSMYVSGIWVWQGDRFAWRPGQWVEQPADWVWMPAHYIWTPTGYLFIDGYWDHPLHERGFLYAPVFFSTPVVQQFVYVPSYVIRPNFLFSALFVRSVSKHYYFGDFFEDRYQRAGFLPWFDYRPSRVSVDPLYAYYRSYQRERDWDRSLRSLYAGRYEGRVARPPRTWSQQQEVLQAALRDRKGAGSPPLETDRLSPLISLQQPGGAKQALQNLQSITNRQVQQVEEEQRRQYRQAVERRREAADSTRQEQFRRLKEQGNRAAPPRQPVELNVPKLPRFEQPKKGKGPPDQPPVKGEPKPRTPPPPPKFQPPSPPKGQPPVKGKVDPPGKAKGKGGPPDPGKLDPPTKGKGGLPGKGKSDPPSKGKGGPPGKGKSDDKKKDDKKKDDKKKDGGG